MGMFGFGGMNGLVGQPGQMSNSLSAGGGAPMGQQGHMGASAGLMGAPMGQMGGGMTQGPMSRPMGGSGLTLGQAAGGRPNRMRGGRQPVATRRQPGQAPPRPNPWAQGMQRNPQAFNRAFQQNPNAFANAVQQNPMAQQTIRNAMAGGGNYGGRMPGYGGGGMMGGGPMGGGGMNRGPIPGGYQMSQPMRPPQMQHQGAWGGTPMGSDLGGMNSPSMPSTMQTFGGFR